MPGTVAPVDIPAVQCVQPIRDPRPGSVAALRADRSVDHEKVARSIEVAGRDDGPVPTPGSPRPSQRRALPLACDELDPPAQAVGRGRVPGLLRERSLQGQPRQQRPTPALVGRGVDRHFDRGTVRRPAADQHAGRDQPRQWVRDAAQRDGGRVALEGRRGDRPAAVQLVDHAACLAQVRLDLRPQRAEVGARLARGAGHRLSVGQDRVDPLQAVACVLQQRADLRQRHAHARLIGASHRRGFLRRGPAPAALAFQDDLNSVGMPGRPHSPTPVFKDKR